MPDGEARATHHQYTTPMRDGGRDGPLRRTYIVTTQDTAHTAYGLVQASIEYAQHYRTVRGTSARGRMESRFKRAYLDRDRLTTASIKLAKEVALA